MPEAARIQEVASWLPEKPKGLGPTYRDRSAWEKAVPAALKKDILAKAKAEARKPVPTWSDEAYLEFSVKGTRPKGEAMMRPRFTRLHILVLAECLENKGRFLAAIEETLSALCLQPTWTLPAHDRGLNNFRRTRYEVDLQAAVQGHVLAQTLYLLDDRLSAQIRERVMAALEERLFAPVLASIETGKHNGWLGAFHNWNAVCLSGVTGAALAVLPSRQERAKFACIGAAFSQRFIAGFNADGYCSEGLGYYNYGFGYFMLLRETLWQATQGKIDLYQDKKVARMARYPLDLDLGGVWPAIADCWFGTQPSPEILWYNGRAFAIPGSEMYKEAPRLMGELAKTCLFLFPNSASLATPAPASLGPTDRRSYFDATGLLVGRTGTGRGLSVTLKGGHNAEHHNHNDVGSFSVALEGVLMVGDPGGPHTYSAATFSPQRYDVHPSISSFGHPVPTVNGKTQRAGREAQAKVLDTTFNDAEDRFTLDLKSAYADETLSRLERHFVYGRAGNGSLTITDHFTFTQPGIFEVALCTHGEWKQLDEKTVEFKRQGKILRATVETPPGAHVAITAQKIEDSAPAFTRLSLKLLQPSLEGELTVRLWVP